MRRVAQLALSREDQQALDQYARTLQQRKDLSTVTIRNYLSDLGQFIAWCENSWRQEQGGQSFNPRVTAPLLFRYRAYLQTTLWLKSSTINQTCISLKCYFAWATRTHLVDVNPHDLRCCFVYHMAKVVLLHRLAQIMGHDSLDTMMLYIRGTKQDLQHDVEKIAWI